MDTVFIENERDDNVSRSKLLLVTAAIFGLIGAVLGAHMAGAGSYAFRPIHAHVLVAGWLTLFAWSVYYKVFKPKHETVAKWQVTTAMIGSIGLTVGMWLYMVKPFAGLDMFSLVVYIFGGVALLVSFALFLILALVQDDKENE